MHATPTAPAGMIGYSVGGVHEDLLPDCTEAIDQIERELRALDIRVDCLKVRSTSAARALHEAAEREEAGLLVEGREALRSAHALARRTNAKLRP